MREQQPIDPPLNICEKCESVDCDDKRECEECDEPICLWEHDSYNRYDGKFRPTYIHKECEED